MSPENEAALLARVAALEEAVEHLTEHAQGDRDRLTCDVCRRNIRGY